MFTLNVTRMIALLGALVLIGGSSLMVGQVEADYSCPDTPSIETCQEEHSDCPACIELWEMEETSAPTYGGGTATHHDYCPDGDFSGSLFDGRCEPLDEEVHTDDLEKEEGEYDTDKHDEEDRMYDDEDLVVCTMEYNPMCGVDGMTYGNPCVLNAAGVELAYEGECRDEDHATDDDMMVPYGEEMEEDHMYDEETVAAYDFAFSLGMTTIDNIVDADLDGTLIRAHMAKMFVEFARDVMGREIHDDLYCWGIADLGDLDEEMERYAVEACQMGIMGVAGDGVTPLENFNPHGIVTRAEAATALSRVLWGSEFDGQDPWYAGHIDALADAGLIVNTDPTLIEQRGYFMIMLHRIALWVESMEEHMEDDAEEVAYSRVIEVDGFDRDFAPNVIEVTQWETVKIVFTSTRGTHDLYIPALDLGTEVLREGEEDSFIVTFDEAGEFEFICTVWNHAAEWMVGVIVVHEASDEEDHSDDEDLEETEDNDEDAEDEDDAHDDEDDNDGEDEDNNDEEETTQE